MRRILPFVAVVAALLAAPAAAQADRALMLTSGNQILSFDTNAPGTIAGTIGVTGLGPGEALKGIDFRPATGQLYGWTALTAVSGTIRTYTLDPSSGAATFVGQTSFTAPDIPAGFGFDAGIDRARYVDTEDRNARINPTDGGSPLGPGGLDSTNSPDVVAVAFDRSFAGATLTTAFAIDRTGSRLDRVGGVDGFPPAGLGSVTPIGPLGFTLETSDGGFDISADGRAFAALTDAADHVTRLYGVNLASGAATSLGAIGACNQPALSLAVVPGTEALPPGAAPPPAPPPPAAADTRRPVGLIDIRTRLKPRALRSSRVRFRFSASEACAAAARLVVRGTRVAAGSTSLTSAGVGQIRLRATRGGRRLLARTRRARATLTLTLTDPAGNTGRVRRSVALRR
jgi:Domain of unknown function (DUF4394)